MYFFGDYDIKKKIEKANSETAIIISFITLVTVFFGVVSIFHSIMHENYRLMVNKKDIFKSTHKVKKRISIKFHNFKNFIICKHKKHHGTHHEHDGH